MGGQPAQDGEAAPAAVDALRPYERDAARLFSTCLTRDADRLRQAWRALRARAEGRGGGGQRDDPRPQPSLERWLEEWRRATARYDARVASIPRPTYPEELPVAARRDEIRALLERHRVVVVCGDTGSGKSTQLPKICLEAGRGRRGAIAHTQPRRLAARSVAARIADELGVPLGGLVGVKTRFDDRTSPETLVSVMTDGLLLAETRHDRELLAYDTIIVDEAHERGLNIDFLLGCLARLLERRRDLSLVITSATIDPARFAEHFARRVGPVPTVLVEGRTYPIETRWRPVLDADGRPIATQELDEEEPELLEAIAAAIEEIDGTATAADASSEERARARRRRDVLAFFSGEREIHAAAEHLRGRFRDSEVVPLYARLSAEEQDRIFRRSDRRRIVLATNVAETSITVPGIEAVVDPGLARISRYSPRGRVQRLPVEPISQASANQRRGRCGRVAPGLCIRLYSEETFAERPLYTQPEILRTNLASVILQMAALGLGHPEDFPFLDPPPQRLVLAGYETLFELGAVTKRHELTPLGRRMALLPVDPRLARVILASLDERCVAEILVIAAALSVQDPRDRPVDKAEAADFAQAAFRDERSDFLGFLKLWKAWREMSESLGSSALRRWCRDHFLSWLRMREWTDVHRQLRDLVVERIAPVDEKGGGRRRFDPQLAERCDANAVHRALLAGFVGSVGAKGEKNEYRAASGGEFHIHPSSVLARSLPPWIMAAEIVETSRRYGRLCAKIQPDWIERIAPHMTTKTQSEPHWLKDSGQVAAWEKVALGALVVVPKRRVPYGPIDPVGARDLFIQQALVEGELRTSGTFLRHNANVRAAIELLQAKGRHADLLVETEARFAFYDARIPAEIHSQPSFERWRKEAERTRPDLLAMRMEDLLRPGAAAPDASRFPDVLFLDDLALPLSYKHAPGAPDDGVTVRIPVAAVNRVDPGRLEWLVPGLVEEKLLALLRSLPKRLRVRFQPAAEFASGAAETLPFGRGDLAEVFAQHLSTLSGVPVRAEDFDAASLDDHVRMRVEITEGEQVLAEGRDPRALFAAHRERSTQDFAAAVKDGAREARFEGHGRSGLLDMPVEPIPESIRFVHAGVPLLGHPALVDEGRSVRIEVFEGREAARAAHRAGVRRLLVLRHRSALDHHVSYLPSFDALALAYAPLGSREALRDALMNLAVDVGILGRGEPPRDRVAFDALAEQAADRLHDAVREAASIAEPLLKGCLETSRVLDGHHPPSWEESIRSMRSDLARLVPRDVFRSVPIERLRHTPRYLGALRVRLRRLAGAVDRDLERMAEIDAWVRRERDLPPTADPAEVERFRFMLEEYRVQSFASELRTAIPVSRERLESQWRRALESRA